MSHRRPGTLPPQTSEFVGRTAELAQPPPAPSRAPGPAPSTAPSSTPCSGTFASASVPLDHAIRRAFADADELGEAAARR